MFSVLHFSSTSHLPVDAVQVYVCFLGPLLPKLWVIQSNVRPVLRRHEAGLGEGGALALALNGDGGGSPLEDLVDVLLTEAAALVVLVHDGSVRSFPQQIFDFLLGELLDLEQATFLVTFKVIILPSVLLTE